ncbi:hypothetical protein D7X55_02740 [Corallococcus sp. AB049A]|uniref:Uncharacterized protein n=1 Tax=Corallococcus interemptor TaxID=2316720 RepID=A0A3A8QDB1_9BACT|nr:MULTISPECIES: DUF6714 family protein [Corallococcus]RKH49680.1 hypothetical protein D7Y23_16045 [Corallococcus sp. AB050B]RKH66108.1 hypothetical protein D7X96_22405 [Corallococcus interemptor]RKI74287.1 hypothetical protein D7X55_02740 [Corallococcus sp. AB049A]
MSDDALRRRIEHAFSGVPRPEKERIAYARGAWETPELVRDFGGRHWKDVPIEKVRDHAAHLPLFSPEALAYYLPAYLNAALVDLDVRDFLLSALTISNEAQPDLRAFFLRRFDRLSPLQKDAIRMFLIRMRDAEASPIAKRHWSQALETYWDVPAE